MIILCAVSCDRALLDIARISFQWKISLLFPYNFQVSDQWLSRCCYVHELQCIRTCFFLNFNGKCFTLFLNSQFLLLHYCSYWFHLKFPCVDIPILSDMMRTIINFFLPTVLKLVLSNHPGLGTFKMHIIVLKLIPRFHPSP